MTEKLMRNIIIIVCLGAVIAIPGIFLINNYLSHQTTNIKEYLVGILFTAVVTISITLTNLWTYRYFKKHYSHHRGYMKTFIVEILVTTFNAALIMSLVILIFMFFSLEKPEESQNLPAFFFSNILIAIIVNLIVMGFVEAYTLFLSWKKATIESERLLREKADARYAALRNQVNPHFLFNSLNSLSSLIRKSPEKAIEFVDKFSRIYRYVLDSGELMLAELQQEIDFIHSFIFLQKIRFGDNLHVNIEIDAQYMNYYLPPLSIQLLLENAIKHNEISSEYPLQVSIYVENGNLIVKNTIKLRTSLEKSTGIGLKNLEERYQHFTDRKTAFYISNSNFIAMIPLLHEHDL